MKYVLIFFMLGFPIGVIAQQLTNIESVEYDPVQSRFLVSNGNRVIEVDGDGQPVGYFGTAPRADFGMEVMDGKLFTIVSSSVRAYDLATSLQVMNTPVSGAQFLNGMASDGNGRIWVTDFTAKKIYELDVSDLNSPVVTEVVSSTGQTPNGVTYDGANNRLVFVTWGAQARIKQVDLTTYEVSDLLLTSLTNMDGIDHDGDGNFYTSSWQPTPRIMRFSEEFTVEEQLTAPGLSSPADICYAMEIDTLAIPNSSSSTVTFLGFSSASVVDRSITPDLVCYPNPITESSYLEFMLPQSGLTRIVLTDPAGREVMVILEENLSAIRHKIALTGLAIRPGVYICTVRQGSYVASVRVSKT